MTFIVFTLPAVGGSDDESWGDWRLLAIGDCKEEDIGNMSRRATGHGAGARNKIGAN